MDKGVTVSEVSAVGLIRLRRRFNHCCLERRWEEWENGRGEVDSGVRNGWDRKTTGTMRCVSWGGWTLVGRIVKGDGWYRVRSKTVQAVGTQPSGKGKAAW